MKAKRNETATQTIARWCDELLGKSLANATANELDRAIETAGWLVEALKAERSKR